MSDVRHRCTITGCNPILPSLIDAEHHRAVTGHRIAKWPVRTAEGQRRAKVRNKTGYYRKYNTGAKSPAARGIPGYEDCEDDHPFSPEALGQWQ